MKDHSEAVWSLYSLAEAVQGSQLDCCDLSRQFKSRNAKDPMASVPLQQVNLIRILIPVSHSFGILDGLKMMRLKGVTRFDYHCQYLACIIYYYLNGLS